MPYATSTARRCCFSGGLPTSAAPQQLTRALQRCRSFCITCVASGTVLIDSSNLLRVGDRNLCLDIALEWRFARRKADDCPFEACPGAGSAPRAQRGNHSRCGSRARAAAHRSSGAGTSAVARRNAGQRALYLIRVVVDAGPSAETVVTVYRTTRIEKYRSKA